MMAVTKRNDRGKKVSDQWESLAIVIKLFAPS